MGEDTKKKGKNVLEIILIIYLILCVVCSAYWVYRKYFAPETTTDFTSHVGVLEDVNGKRCAVEVVYYENRDNSGVELLDVKLNGYSDINNKNIVSFGIQIVGDFNNLKQAEDFHKVTKKGPLLGWFNFEGNYYYSFISGDYGKQNAESGMLNFYEEVDGFNYASLNRAFNDFGDINIDLNNVNYKFKLGYKRSSSQFLTETRYRVSSLSEFIKTLYVALKGQSSGHKYTEFKFDNMFQVMQEQNGVYEDISTQDSVYNYFYIDINHYTSGAKSANDSLFKQIQHNTNYVYLNNSLLDEHFRDENTYYLTERNCTFTYNSTTHQHDFDISTASYNEYKNKNLNYKLVIDKDYLDSINVVLGNLKSNSNLARLGITKYYIKENGVITGVTI